MTITINVSGDPKRQHSVVYFHIVVSKTSEELQPQIVLQEQEVGASAWFDHGLASLAIQQHSNFPQGEPDVPDATEEVNHNIQNLSGVPKTFTIYQVNSKGGPCKPIEWPTSVLKLRVNGEDGESDNVDVERLSSGTIFALQEWIHSKYNKQ